MPKFAQILSGVVQNVIVLPEYNDVFKEGFDELINVDDVYVGPGFSYINNEFVPPALETEIDP